MKMGLHKLFRRFFDNEKLAGLILLAASFISLLAANSSFGNSYNGFWHAHINLSFASLKLDRPVENWINDGLMSLFFLLLGLEIKKELLTGKLASLKNAVLPVGAAIGGMLVQLPCWQV
jgi:NhaA family Na+:H+ antiporter